MEVYSSTAHTAALCHAGHSGSRLNGPAGGPPGGSGWVAAARATQAAKKRSTKQVFTACVRSVDSPLAERAPTR